MPLFSYVSADTNGETQNGKMNANDETDLQLKLKGEGLLLVECSVATIKKGKPMKTAVLTDFCRQLGSLLDAGISLVRALTIIAEEEDLKPVYKERYLTMLRTIKGGISLSEAMVEQGDAFPPLLVSMIRAAENSGNMAETATRLADHYAKESQIKSKISTAFTYPKILGALIVVVVVVIMAFVMPQFEELFKAMPEMPLATKILFGLSDFIVNFWWLAIMILIGLIVCGRIALKLPKVQIIKDQLLLELPLVGKLLRTIYTARFARTLSSLYSCGVPIVDSLRAARAVIGNKFIESQFDVLIPYVQSGNPLSEGIANVDGFAKKLSSATRVGEEAGNLEHLLAGIADSFDFDSEATMEKLVSYLEPVMIIVMAVIVGFIMFAVVMPIYDSYSYIG